MPEPESVRPGIEATIESVVTEEMTARRIGSGDVAVLATPMVLTLVERAAMAALKGRLPKDRTSVGAWVDLHHVAPSPIGVTVAATARLERVDGRRLEFSVRVSDPAGVVAHGTHTRVVVDRASFGVPLSRGTSSAS